MEFEYTAVTRYDITLSDDDLNQYWIREPNERDTSEVADNIRDRRTESLDAILHIIRYQADVGNLKGTITAYDDIWQDDDTLASQVHLGLKDPNVYWCLHYEVDIDEEIG